MVTACARVPLRIDMPGWTDVPAWCTQNRGVVVNIAICSLSVWATFRAGTGNIRLTANGETMSVQSRQDLASLHPNGAFAVLRAIILREGVDGGHLQIGGCRVPPGAGLGGSGAVEVAALGAIRRARTGKEPNRDEICQAALEIEHHYLNIDSGAQDQRASAFGGINCWTFGATSVDREALLVSDDFKRELARRTLLVYSGASHAAAQILASVAREYENGNRQIAGALARMNECAQAMRDALVVENFRGVGNAMWEILEAQRNLHQPGVTPAITTDSIEAILAIARNHKALGAKIAGAGAGGTVVVYCDTEQVEDTRRAIEQHVNGAVLYDVSIDNEGLRTWTTS